MNERTYRSSPLTSIGFVALLMAFPAGEAWSAVPRDLETEHEATVDEALSSDDAEARAWALRAKTLLGRESRQILSDHLQNTDLQVRVFAAIGLIDLGRREGAESLAGELIQAGTASRERILNRYVRHLSERDQVRVLEQALDGAEDTSATRTVVRFIARFGHGDVYELLNRAVDADEATRAVYVDEILTAARRDGLSVARRLGRSSDAGDRLAAVTIAAALPTGEAHDFLEELLNDSDGQVSTAASLALAPLGISAAYERLAELAETGDAQAQASSLEAIRDGQPSLLDFDRLLSMLDTTEDPALRRTIYQAIGATRSDQAYQMLAELVDGTVYEDRLAGISGLGYTRRETAVAILGPVLLGGGGEDLRRSAAEALGNLHHAAANEPLLAALQRERGGQVKVAVVRSLASEPSEDALWPLAFLLSDRDSDVVLATLDTLEALGARDVASQVENAAISHRDAQVRWRATLVLFALDPEVGIIRLNQALDRPPEGFMNDLDGLVDGPREDAMRRLLRHSNPDIRMLALGRVMARGDEAMPIYRELIAASTPSDVRQIAVDMLTANRDAADLATFVELSDTSHRTMRSQALEALVELAAPETEEQLRGLLEASDVERRVMAVYGLWHLASN